MKYRVCNKVRKMVKSVRHCIMPLLALLVVVLLCMTSCTADTAYHHYVSIDEEGWENRDTLVFNVDTIQYYGDYTLYACLRTNREFPYRFISLEVTSQKLPAGKVERSVVRCEIANKDGVQEGVGITYHTYEIPVTKLWLTPKDSMRVTVSHRMAREYMPGIINVGVKVKR